MEKVITLLKKATSRLIIIFLLSIILLPKTISAQIGNDCSNPILLTVNSCSDSFATTDSVMWFAFIPTSNNIVVSVVDFQANLSGTHFFNNIELFSSCNVSPIDSASPSPPSSFLLHNDSLIPNATYYLKMQRHETDSAFFKICLSISSPIQPCNCLPNGYNPLNPCDYICNGGFENLIAGVCEWDELYLA